MKPITVHIDLAERSYDITIGKGILSSVFPCLPFHVKGKKIFIFTDKNVQALAGSLRDQFVEAGASWCQMMVLEPGERTKSYDSLKEAHGWMLSNTVHRDSVVFAVGGGVIGDLAGFAAATVLRGVPFVQVPTSLLAQVDSSVGGKTGINTPYGKNLVGSFYQPCSVVIDIDTLKTLPQRELFAGYAEIVKYGLLGDRAFFEWMEDCNGKQLLALEPDVVVRALEVSCQMKAAVVQADEKERGQRALLNLGHTFGHAFEALAGYNGSLLHGEAVAMGIVLAFDLSVRMGLCPAEDYERVVAHFRDVGLPVGLHDTDAVETLQANGHMIKDIMRRDKKVKDGKMAFILARGIGDCFTHNDVPENLLDDVLENFLERD
ncbi:MAG: 3-dehydroquinate synthase [Alphaproteobacteria bacterium]